LVWRKSQYTWAPFSNDVCGSGAAPEIGACTPTVIVELEMPVRSPATGAALAAPPPAPALAVPPRAAVAPDVTAPLPVTVVEVSDAPLVVAVVSPAAPPPADSDWLEPSPTPGF
jgi:hypothetical protein